MIVYHADIRYTHTYIHVCGLMTILASFPGLFEGGGERAWYTQFTHAHNIPNIPWNQDTLVICPCYVTCRSVAQLTCARWQN